MVEMAFCSTSAGQVALTLEDKLSTRRLTRRRSWCPASPERTEVGRGRIQQERGQRRDESR